MPEQVDRYLIALAAKVTEVLETLDEGDPSPGHAPFGNYYVARVTFGFDGDNVPRFAVIPDEHGGYAVQVGDE